MIESLLKELLPLPTNQTDEPDEVGEMLVSDESEDLLLEALPVVEIIVRRKTVSSWQSEASDLVQRVALRLLKWRNKYFERSSVMTSSEWKSFAARTAYNEINRHYGSRNFSSDVPLDVAEAAVATVSQGIKGETDAEVYSLARVVWQEICSLTLRQRRALLLHSQELIIIFLQSGIPHEEFARILELSASEWANIRVRIGLPDFEIACLSLIKNGENRNFELATASVKKARFEARVRLKGKLTKK